MEERPLRVLEFHQFLQTLKAYASSEVGQALCLSLRPSQAIGEVESLLREVAAASDILREEGDVPLEGIQEVRPLLACARAEGACLLPEELLSLRSTLAGAERAKQFLRHPGERHALMKRWAEEIPEFGDLYGALCSALGPRGEILDSASPELRQIRKEISRIRGRIRTALEGLWEQENFRKIFQEQIITLRNDRYVVAVKAESKNSLPGIIHDQSQSKATYFIEPFSTVEENNELNLLLKDEKEEERRILLALTAGVREQSDRIAQAVEVLGRLDLVFAKAKWARASRGTIPLLNDEGNWYLLDARHPFLESKSAVPIDLQLANGQSTLIITGANTGGKTVALKTLGLLTLLAQCGIPIPASEGSRVAVFSKIFADIGDEQSLQDNLSTFSAWVLAISQILKEADKSSLVLLDEVGGGTDPSEGAALAMALIDGLRARGAKTVVTTHLHLLKAYGAIHPDVVNVSVEFNPVTLRPTYRLMYGQPGESYALLMAEKWGIPPELVERANAYLGEGDRQVGELLQSLERTQREMEAKLHESERMKREVEIAREKGEEFLQRAQMEEKIILSQAREEARELVQQAREELRRLINEFKAKGRTDVHRLGQQIKAEEEKITHRLPAERVEGSPANSKGAIQQDWGTAGSPGAFGQLKETLALKSGENSKTTSADQPGLIQYQIPSAARELKVIGLRVEEALPLVDRAIDKAFLGGLKELEVIHGAGTGRLRKAIREHLRGHALVKAFLPGGPGRGGDGVTLVEIGPAPAAAAAKRRSNKERAERS
jgi:DNA mismatch repair protein MutS2